MTLEQVKAAQPAIDYEPVYGTSASFWTTDQFIEAAYAKNRSLDGRSNWTVCRLAVQAR